QHVLGLADLAEGEDQIVIDHPQFVRGGLVAGVGKGLRGPPDRLVRLAAQSADPGRPAIRYSVHVTSGWSRRAVCAASYCARSTARKLSLTDTKRPPLDSRHLTVSCRTSSPAAVSSRGISDSRPILAGPMAVISNTPVN